MEEKTLDLIKEKKTKEAKDFYSQYGIKETNELKIYAENLELRQLRRYRIHYGIRKKLLKLTEVCECDVV